MAAETTGLTVTMRQDGARDDVVGLPSMPMSIKTRGAVGRLTLLAAALAIAGLAHGQTPATLSDPAKAMIGAWEISNAARDKRCAVSFKADAVPGGFKLEFDPPCADFPVLREVGVWDIGPKDAVRLFDSKGAIVLDFSEVESGMFEAERKGEGLFFMRSQAAIKAATVSPEQLFGDWTLLQEADKPLCKLTLSSASGGEDAYRIVVKPGCTAEIVGLALATWRLEVNDLLLIGRGGTWRFSESDATVWERIPPSTDPMVLMR
jgi:hypothetical protein